MQRDFKLVNRHWIREHLNFVKNKQQIDNSSELFIVSAEQAAVSPSKKIREIKEQAPHAKVLVITDKNDCCNFLNYLEWGADGCLCEPDIPEKLVNALSDLSKYGVYMPGNSHSLFIDQLLHLQELHPPYYKMVLNRDEARKIFSERECDVLELMLQGKTAMEMSEKLYVSISTINDNTDAIFKKLQVNNRISAINKILQTGIAI